MTAGSTGTVTRQRLLDAGERLFARKGIDAVRLTDLNHEAGQRNASALHYHFGSRDGLVRAILARHQEATDARRRAVLDECDASPGSLVRALVEPAAANLLTPSGRDFLRIVPQVLHGVGVASRVQPFGPVLRETLARIGAVLPDMPEPLRLERLALLVTFLADALADRARSVDGSPRSPVDHDSWVRNLCRMLTAAAMAPPA